METTSLETLVAQNTEVLCSIYAALLFMIGVGCAVGVIVLLYKFLRKFF